MQTSSETNGAAPVLRWVGKGMWTIADQALFAGSNLIINFLLARWLTQRELGAFSIAYSSVFLLIGALHTGLITEPMLVYGVKDFSRALRAYLGVLIRFHVAFALAASGCVAAAGAACYAAGAPELGQAFLALTLMPPLALFLWLLRKMCYVQLRPRQATEGGCVYAVAAVAGTFVLATLHMLNTASALVLISASALCAAVWLSVAFYRTVPASSEKVPVSRALALHWSYGRWAAGTQVLSWMPQHILYPLLGIWFGLESSAALKAVMIFIMPAAHSYSALTVLLLPAFVTARRQNKFRRFVSLWFVVIGLATILYWLLLGLFGPAIMSWALKGKYDAYAGLLWIIGSIPVFASLGSVICTAFRALEKPQFVLWSYAGSALVTLTAGIALIYAFNEAGAAFGNALSKAVGLIIIAALIPVAGMSKKNEQNA